MSGDRRGAEYEGAQARDEGFQEMTSAWGTGAWRAPQSGRRSEARRVPIVSKRYERA